MTRQILGGLTALAIACSMGCHRKAPERNDNNNRGDIYPHVEASRYPYTPPTVSDRVITLRITQGSQTGEITQFEGSWVRIERGRRPAWERSSPQQWTMGLSCAITDANTVKISFTNISAALDPALGLFHERSDPIASCVLLRGSPVSTGTNPELNFDLVAIADWTEHPGVMAEARHSYCCIGCEGLQICAIGIVMDCGSCKTREEDQAEQDK